MSPGRVRYYSFIPLLLSGLILGPASVLSLAYLDIIMEAILANLFLGLAIYSSMCLTESGPSREMLLG
jgi:hypothetical protein